MQKLQQPNVAAALKGPASYAVKRPLITGLLALMVVTGGIYYAQGSEAAETPAAPAATPVTVRTLAPQDIKLWTEFSGRLHAVDAAEIRPEVSGRITEVRFEDGADVAAGDILFVIDPQPYEAAVAKAQANLTSARTNAQFAALDYKRAQGMVKSSAIPKRIFDERANANRVAQASVSGAEAELKQARIDLDHAFVKAPIDGRASRAEITLGNLVQAGPGAPLLTTVVSNKTIYADFEVDEQTYIQTIRAQAVGKDQERQLPVQLHAQGDQAHVYEGTIDSFDNRIDVASGTIRARAKFDNADGALIPGMFVSVKLASASGSNALLVPERAIGFDQSKKYVFVVGEDSKVAYREVQLGRQVDAQRVVLSGLNAGDRVIVDGVQHVRPEAVVEAKEEGQNAQKVASR